MLEKIPEVELVGETATAADAPLLAKQQKADILLLDVTMPGPGYLATIQAVKEAVPETKVLVVSGHDEMEYAVPALRAGASGYVMKSFQPLELVEAIRRVYAGRRYVSADLADQLASGLGTDGGDQPPHYRLSARELEVLTLMASGKSLKEIAARLDINAKTVSSYRARILEKLGVASNAEIVRYAIEHDLVQG